MHRTLPPRHTLPSCQIQKLYRNLFHIQNIRLNKSLLDSLIYIPSKM